MKNLFSLILIFVTSISVNAQTGTVVNYVDNFGPITLTYNGLVNGKHSYQGTDAGPPNVVVTVRWTGSQWAIFINVSGGGDDLSFTSAVNTASNPPNFTIGMWVDVLPDPGGDGTTLLGLSGSGTTSMPLPVELVEFGATKTGKSILLNWMTASEVNNSGFDIQRSTDGRDWKVIGFENGVDNSAEVQNYNFIDTHPAAGINYYRLKQVDHDGKYDYSPIVSVRNIGDEKYDVSPNPFNDFLTFTTNVDDLGIGLMSIFNTQGLKIKEFRNQNGILDTSDLIPGVYIVNFPSGDVTKVVKH